MPGGFEVRQPILPQEGIPVHRNGDPVEKTYVVTKDWVLFERFCHNARVNPVSESVKFVSALSSPAHVMGEESSLVRDDNSWKQVVFVGVNPSAYGELIGPDWNVLESRRGQRQFTRAWIYPHLLITPNLADPPSVEEMFTNWEEGFNG